MKGEEKAKTFQAKEKGKSSVKLQDRELVFWGNASMKKSNIAQKEIEEVSKGQNLGMLF